SLALRLDRTMERDDAWARDAFDVGLVKLDIEIEQHGGRRLRSRRRSQLAVHGTQAANNFLAPFGRQRGRLARGQPLEVPNDEEHFAAVAASQRRYDATLIRAL